MNNKVTLIVLIFIASIGALVLGSTIGQAKFVDLSIYGLVMAALLYLLFFYRFTWQIVLLLAWSGMTLNYGFALTSVHYAAVLLILYGMITVLLRKTPYPKPDLFRRPELKRLVFYLSILLLFGAISFTFNKVSPYPGGVYSTKNMLKGYFDAFGVSFVLLLALIFPFSFRVGKNVIVTIISILLIACLINMANLAYLFSQGYGAAGDEIALATDEPMGAFVIPIVNASFGIYTMRGVGPIAVMFSFAALCNKQWFASSRVLTRILTVAVFITGLGGAFMSGGRAAILLCLFYIGVIAIVNRRTVMIFGAMMVGLFVVVAANIFSSTINNKLPLFMARPLQYVMIEKGEAMRTIDSSSDVRRELYIAALEEWWNNPRITAVGRSVYTSPPLDEEAKRMGSNVAAFVSVGLKTGSCHALLPSVLLQYGLVGGVLYYTVYFAIFLLFLKIYRICKTSRGREIYSGELRLLAFLMTISTGFSMLVATIGGNWFGILPLVMIVLVKSMAARDEKIYKEALEKEGESTTTDSRLQGVR